MQKEHKSLFEKGNAAIMIVVLLIVSIVVYECYSVTHIELKTQTASVTTVYNKIDAKGLFIRNEKVIRGKDYGVTVPTVSDGSKLSVNGNVAMLFSSSEKAQNYSKKSELEDELSHYVNLQSQSVGQAGNLEVINSEIDEEVIKYSLYGEGGISDADSDKLNEILVKRSLLIGEKVDLNFAVNKIKADISALGSCEPDSYINTSDAGVFTSYTDGWEDIADYSTVEETTIGQFKSIVKKIENKDSHPDNLGKVITDFCWYIQAVVPSSKVVNLKDGQRINIALKNDSEHKLKVTIVSGAEPEPKQEETLLILKCNEMNVDIAKYRYENIEIIVDSFEGIKIPADALHVVDDKKGVFVLISSQVKFREATVVYSDDDYVLIKYDENDADGIRLYDKIITKGKDLQDGKVYT